MKTAVSPQFLLKLLPSGLIGATAVLLLLSAGVTATVQHWPAAETQQHSTLSAATYVRASEKSAKLESFRANDQLPTAGRPAGRGSSPLSSTSRPPQSAELLPRLHFHFGTIDLPARPQWRPETTALQMVLRRAIPVRAGPAAAA
ncbi:MAG: hypothetical protein AB7F32_04400 [Victivallaceae bacterium]